MMWRRLGIVLPSVAVAAVLWMPAHAQATSEARGKIVDASGKPAVGVTVVFTGAVPPNPVYREKTDKKGGFWFPNLLYYPPGRWKVMVEAEGYNVAKLKGVSRKSDRTLLGEFNTKIRLGGPPAEILIAGLGEAVLEFTLDKEAEAPPTAGAAGGSGGPVEQDPIGVAGRMVADGNLEGSVPFFLKAIEAKPDDAERREFFAKVLYKLDRFGESEVQATKAAQIAPTRPGPNLILAEIAHGKGDLAKAWEFLARERALSPGDVRVLERVASLADELGRTDEALRVNEEIVRLKPDNVEAWVSLGGLYSQTNQLEKSEAAFRKVVELDPDNAAETFYNIGAVIANKPDLSDADNRKALEAFRKAVEIKADYAAAHREMAFAYLRANDAAGARAELQRYLELAPNAADAQDIQATIKSLKK